MSDYQSHIQFLHNRQSNVLFQQYQRRDIGHRIKIITAAATPITATTTIEHDVVRKKTSHRRYYDRWSQQTSVYQRLEKDSEIVRADSQSFIEVEVFGVSVLEVHSIGAQQHLQSDAHGVWSEIQK